MKFSSLFYPVTVQPLPVTLTNFRQGLEWDNLLTVVETSSASWNSQSANVVTLSSNFNNFKTEVQTTTATLLPTTVFQETSGIFAIDSDVTAVSSELGNLRAEVVAVTAVLLPTTVFQEVSGIFAIDSDVTAVSSDLVDLKTEVEAATATLLPTTAFQQVSGSFATNTTVNNVSSLLVLASDFNDHKTSVEAATATLLPTTAFQQVSGSFSTNATVNSVSSLLVLASDFNNYKTSVEAATATLLPTTIYQNASGNWQGTFTTVQNNSASYIVDGGNSRGSNINIGTNDNFNLSFKTGNTARIVVLNSGNIGVGTTTPNTLLTVSGQISSTNTIFAFGGNSDIWNSVYTNVQTNSSGWVEPLRRFDFIDNSPITGASTSYIGTALPGTATTSEAWKITRIIFTTTGSVSSNQVRENVAWSMRTSLQYFNP